MDAHNSVKVRRHDGCKCPKPSDKFNWTQIHLEKIYKNVQTTQSNGQVWRIRTIISNDADGRTHILKMLVIIQFKAYHRVYPQNCEG